MRKITYLLLFSVLAILIGTSAKAPDAVQEKESIGRIIKIKNTTNFTVDEIHISAPEEDNWGPDLLEPDEVLMPGEVIEVEVDCGTWDILLVADDQSTCEVREVHLCSSQQWNIVADCN